MMIYHYIFTVYDNKHKRYMDADTVPIVVSTKCSDHIQEQLKEELLKIYKAAGADVAVELYDIQEFRNGFYIHLPSSFDSFNG